MVKRIASIGNVVQRENPETKVVEYVPVFQVELWNRLKDVNPNMDIDLQFSMVPEDYTRMYRKELTFGSIEEMDACRKILMKIKSLDDDDKIYVVLNSPFTNSILILDKDLDGESVSYDNIKQYEYMVDILKWINEQERYF
jgi:hypothetical protein